MNMSTGLESRMSFCEILEHAVLQLKPSDSNGSAIDPLPVLRQIVSECPRIPSLEVPVTGSGTLSSALQLSSILADLIENGKGSVPQLAALGLCCVLPATLGVTKTSSIYSSCLFAHDNGKGFLFNLLQSIEATVIQLDSSVSPLSSGQPTRTFKNRQISRLHFVNGIMQCPTSQLLLLQPDKTHEGKLLLHSTFDVIQSACTSLVTRNHPSTVKTLISWLLNTKETLRPTGRTTGCVEDKSDAILSAIFPCLQRSLCILNCCLWDSKAFGLLLDLCLIVSEMCSEEQKANFPLTNENLLLCAMYELPWRSKRKLQMLAELLPRCGEKQVLKDFPELPKGIVQSLAYNELQSVGADVYKVLLKSLNAKEFSHYFTNLHVLCLKNENTIQGLTNYWLPALIKKIPTLVSALEQKVKGDLMAEIVLLQVQRREGLISFQSMFDTTEYYHTLCNGLTTYNLDIRTRAFDALCTGMIRCSSSIPAETMDKILKLAHGFIMDNLSVASQAARHSIMCSLSVLLPAVRDYLALVVKKGPPDIDLLKTEKSKPSASFLRWLYHFLVHNLEPGNNYQRHIASLRVYATVLQEFTDKTMTARIPVAKLIRALEKCECWHFHSLNGAKAILRCVISPTDDVRITATNLLRTHPELSSKLPNASEMLCEGLKLCSSQQFYIIESGSLLYTVGTLLVSESVVPNFSELLMEANKQFVVLQNGLVIGALQGSPVHGILQAMLHLLQIEALTKVIPMECLLSVLTLIEQVVAHLLTVLNTSSSTQDFAPSFEDMDFAIESQISDTSAEKSLHLTPQYQIAVNCAWLNLKVCCELASQLGCVFSRTVKDEALVERCGYIMMSVLQKCRHKGAFEAAGVALASFVRHTSDNGSKVHQMLLEHIMRTLINRGKNAPPLSRRSAGLAVAVHKIVTSDTDVEKSLLHLVVSQVLYELQIEETSADVEHDPKEAFTDTLTARLMHVLYTLVSDAATRQHVARHLENIALASLRRLESPNWGIRNAAMQLFGAVATKLTAQPSEWDSVGAGLLEDIEISQPRLLEHLTSELRRAAEELVQSPKIMRNYTSLEFHLGLLVRLTPGPPILRTCDQIAIMKELCSYCWVLLSSPAWAVREQSAACILTLTSIPDLPQLLCRAQKELPNAPENRRHGCLLLISKAEKKIYSFLYGMPKDLGLNECHTSTITLNKAQIKPPGSYVCHQLIKFKDIKKGEFFRILRELSKYPCSKHVAKMLWTADLAENVVLAHKGISAGEILDKCLEAESLFYVQERVLSTICVMINNNELIDELLDIQLILYETLDHVLISMNCSRHKLILVLKVLVAIKRKLTERYVKDNMLEFHGTSAKNNELESANRIKQWIHVIGETLWVQPLISLLEENLYGDEFELYAFELLGLYALELTAARYMQECVDVLTPLTELMQLNLQEDLPDRTSVGRALAATSLVTWNLHSLCTGYDVSPGNIGYTVLRLTGELLSEHNVDAAQSVWPLSCKRNGEALNPVFCLRQMCKFGAEKLMSSKLLYSYLWHLLSINIEELHQSALVDTENIVSPFSHGSGEMDLENLDFIAVGFKYLDYYRNHLISKEPKLAAIMPDYHLQLPGSTPQEFKEYIKELVNSIAIFRKQATGSLQWLPLEMNLAIRRLSLKLWIHLDILQKNGIDLSLIDLDGKSAQERVYHLRRHLNTRNQLDNPDFNESM